ncbi:hypothetical protein [Shinella sp.]|uniref:hypothetical protein n=1 Tax=Shinella sp. TaxID=1870904 RepID=UPI003D2C77B5
MLAFTPGIPSAYDTVALGALACRLRSLLTAARACRIATLRVSEFDYHLARRRRSGRRHRGHALHRAWRHSRFQGRIEWNLLLVAVSTMLGTA